MRTLRHVARSALLGSLLVACTGEPPAPVAPPSDDPLLLIGDVEHLLDRALAEQRVGDASAASRTLGDAYTLFERDVTPLLADEPELVLRAEYMFGRLRASVGSRHADPAPLLVPVREALGAARARAAREAGAP